jgi:DnaJ-class molecular chaperone
LNNKNAPTRVDFTSTHNMGKDYYSILGLSRGANENDIRNAYKKLAMKWHPDKNVNNKEAAESKFKEVSEAYEVLSDPQKKATYDQFGEEGLRADMGGQSGFSGFRDPFSVFETFFGPGSSFHFSSSGPGGFSRFGGMGGMGGMSGMGGGMGGSPFGFSTGGPFSFDDFDFPDAGKGHTTGRKRKADTINQPFSCSLEDLYRGCTKRMKFTRRITDTRGSQTTEDRILDIVVKPGWKAGTKVTFHNEGDVSPGLEPADICFVLEEEPHTFFKREGNDLIYTANINLAQAFTGVKLTIPGLDSQQRVASIRDIVHPKYEHRIPGAGMPISKTPGAFGDLVIRFDIKFPTQMNPTDKNQLKNLILANM